MDEKNHSFVTGLASRAPTSSWVNMTWEEIPRMETNGFFSIPGALMDFPEK